MPAAASTLSVLAEPEDARYLALLGERTRGLRARRGVTRRDLAAGSGVSERYLAKLESGRANVSVLLLRRIARALDVPLEELIDPVEGRPVEHALLRAWLRDADAAALRAAHEYLEPTAGAQRQVRRRRIALVGLRGAGKSTVGAALAQRLGLPFVELVQEIEREAGAGVAAILASGGQAEYRRLERAALEGVIARFDGVVVATGGSLVSEPATYHRLLGACYTVWLKATPAEHMTRVVAQGDHRPMADNRQAMADLKRILGEREHLYRRADRVVDTAGGTVATVVDELSGVVAAPAPADRPSAPPSPQDPP